MSNFHFIEKTVSKEDFEENIKNRRKKYFKLLTDKIRYSNLLFEGKTSIKKDLSYGTEKISLKLQEICQTMKKLRKEIDFWNEKVEKKKKSKNVNI